MRILAVVDARIAPRVRPSGPGITSQPEHVAAGITSHVQQATDIDADCQSVGIEAEAIGRELEMPGRNGSSVNATSGQ